MCKKITLYVYEFPGKLRYFSKKKLFEIMLRFEKNNF